MPYWSLWIIARGAKLTLLKCSKDIAVVFFLTRDKVTYRVSIVVQGLEDNVQHVRNALVTVPSVRLDGPKK